MGLLDGILGSVMNAALGGTPQAGNNPQVNNPQANNPLGGLLSRLGGAQGAGGGGAALLAMAMTVVQSQGGVSGLVNKFRQSGLGQQADSWVGTGPNQAVAADQVHQVLGGDAIGAIAAKLGVAPAQASATMAQLLPELINQMTPGGQVPAEEHSLLAEGLKMLQGMTRS
jgi:uncharacterized protein YidB (DUF937 family)